MIVLKKINNFCNSVSENEATIKDDDYKKLITEENKNLSKYGIVINLGDENYIGEAIKHTSVSFMAQEKLQDEFVELRILRTYSGKLLIMGREDLLNDNDGDMISTHIKDKESFIEYINKQSKTLVSNTVLNKLWLTINKAVSSDDFPGKYGSVDVWITPTTGEWGIFEFQPQYSSLNISDDVHNLFMEQSINDFYNLFHN